MSGTSERNPGWRAYAAALASVALAGAFRLWLDPVVGTRVPYAVFYIAILWTAWYGGVGPALLAAAAGAAVASLRFGPPVGAAAADHWIGLALYFVVSGMGVTLIASQRRARSRADQSAALAEERLKQLQVQIEFRERAEARSLREHRLAEQTLASIGDAVIATDASGRIEFINPVAATLTGWSGAEAAGQELETVFDIAGEETGEEAPSPIHAVLRDGVAQPLSGHTVLRTRGGRSIPIDDSAAPIRDEAGNVIGAVLVFRDVSARRQTERVAAQLAAIVSSSLDAIIGKTLDGIIQTWNHGAERIYGYTAEEAIGKPISIISPPDRIHEESDIVEHMRGGDALMQFETVRVRKDGTRIQVSLTISPIRDPDGRVIGISHIARDITRQKEFDEQLRQTQRLESLGVLAGGLAHDFNNLLTGILGNASVAADLAADRPAISERLQEVVKASERAAQLVRQMLAYAGKGKFIVEPVNLSAVVSEIASFVRTYIPRSVEVRLDLAPDLPPVEADSSQMQQVVMNLLINAAEAIGEHSGVVSVRTAVHDVADGDLRPGRYVALEVADTGSGMDEATQARIFEPFFTTKFTGRGLGLSAVMGIVRGHHGNIQVRSAPGRGSTFTVLFPATEAAVARPGEKAEVVELSGNGTILVVDDEEMVRRTARYALERYGYDVLLAENGKAGVDLLAATPGVSAVILDLTMPVMSGEEALRHIKRVRPDVPVLLSSGFNEAEAMRRFGGRGVAAFLQKPYTARDLAAKVRTVLQPAPDSGGTIRA